jgi:3-phosphoshikimate 1-carboxyvinyltransferase
VVNLISFQAKPLKGNFILPGDKSISHRAIILASIAKGISHIHGFLDAEDCLRTLQAFRSLGIKIEGPFKNEIIVEGKGKYGLTAPKMPIDCGNSGTTMRLLSGLLVAQPFNSILIGDKSLQKRPMARICKPLKKMQAKISCHIEEYCPLYVEGQAKLQGIDYTIPEASAQVKSSLLFAGMYAQGKTKITEALHTRDHTEKLLSAFTYPIKKQDKQIEIEDNMADCLGIAINIPGDISSAAFFIVAASIIPHSNIILSQVGINPTRIGVIQILNQMGAKIQIKNQRQYSEEPVADLHVQYAALKGIEIDSNLIVSAIDEFPIILVAAACATGKTILRKANELRKKESDRIMAMENGLKKLGIAVQALTDGLIVEGGIIQGGEIDSYYDHRIAMAFSIAGAIAKAPIIIKNSQNIATSFPNFIQFANNIGLSIQEFSQ